MEKIMNKEPDTMKALLANTVYMLCKDGFSFKRNLTIKGLIVVSIDDEALIVQMDKKFCHSLDGEVVAINNHANDNNTQDIDESVENFEEFCGDITNGSQAEEKNENNPSLIHHQVHVHKKEVSKKQSSNKKYQAVECRDIHPKQLKNENGTVDSNNFLLNFPNPSDIKLEATSDNEDANDLLASINTDYNSYLEQENDTSAISSGSSPLNIFCAAQALGHARSSASSTSSHCNKSVNNSQLQQQIKKDIFNYDEEGRRLKNFECQYDGCTKAFFRKDHLTRHQRIKHGKPYGVESQNIYKCCGKTFYKHRSLLKHIKETHPDREDTSVLLIVNDNGCYEHASNGHSQRETDDGLSPLKMKS